MGALGTVGILHVLLTLKRRGGWETDATRVTLCTLLLVLLAVGMAVFAGRLRGKRKLFQLNRPPQKAVPWLAEWCGRLALILLLLVLRNFGTHSLQNL